MEDITVSELKERLERGEKFHFIEFREEWEYEEDNLGADNIPLGELAHQLSQLEKIKDEEIVVHCRSGARSGNATKFLQITGFTKVRNALASILAF